VMPETTWRAGLTSTSPVSSGSMGVARLIRHDRETLAVSGLRKPLVEADERILFG
jgi:hypothetical protein